VLAKLDPATHASARLALTSGFHLAFLACFGLSVLALLIVLGMRDLPLRSAPAHEPGAEPAALAH
jgi:hypothetical protein